MLELAQKPTLTGQRGQRFHDVLEAISLDNELRRPPWKSLDLVHFQDPCSLRAE